jgi:hypothetical protein
MHVRGHRMNELNVLLDVRRNGVRHRADLLAAGRDMTVGRERRVEEAAGLRCSGREAEPVTMSGQDLSADAFRREPLRDSLDALRRGSHVRLDLCARHDQSTADPRGLRARTCAAFRCWPYFALPGVETSMSVCWRPATSLLWSAIRMWIGVALVAALSLAQPCGTSARASCRTSLLGFGATAAAFMFQPASLLLALDDEGASGVHVMVAWRMTAASAAHAMMRAAEGAMPNEN